MKQNLLRHIIISLLLFISISSFGQQDPMFTQYMNNPQLINPAYAGSHGNINFNGIFRKQWAGGGVPWSPTTTSLSVNGPFLDYKVGVGLDFMSDVLGPLAQTSIHTNYSYQLEFNNNSILSLGIKAGFNFYQKDLQNLSTEEYDFYVNQNPLTEKYMFNAGVGAYYFSEKYFIGASIPKLVRNSLVDYENTLEINSRQEQHLFLTAGYIFEISPLLKLKPTFMLRMVNGSPFSKEVTGTAILVDKLWIGLMYRFQDAIAVHARIEVQDGFQLGYSYDLTTSELRPFNSGTHEIFFSYTIKKQGKRILSPRYF